MKKLIEKFRFTHILYKCIVILGVVFAAALLAGCPNPSGGGGEDIDPALYELLAGLYEGDEFDYMFEIDETGMGGTGFVIDHDDSSLSIRAANAGPSSGQTFTWKVLRVRGDKVDVEITVEGEQPVKAVFNTKDNTVTIDGKSYKLKDASPELKAVPSVGSIIMKDGSLKTSDSITADDKSNAIAVVYKVDTVNKKAWAVGKVQSERINWDRVHFPDFIAQGHHKRIFVTYVKGDRGNYTFTGYIDGRASLAKLKANVSDYWGHNYPAWEWCENYGTKQAGLTGDLAKGWYFPSIAELFEIWQQKRTVNISLAAVDGNQCNTDCVVSSSQLPSPEPNYKVCVFGFLDVRNGTDGWLSTRNKDDDCVTRAVRVFTYD